MDKSYYYNYLKEYVLEVGDRIIGFNKELLEDNDALHDFLESRAQLALEEFENNNGLLGGCGLELAMQTLLADLTELEPTEEEIEAEAKYQKEMEEYKKIMNWVDSDDFDDDGETNSNPDFKVIIAGSRGFNNYDVLRDSCENILFNFKSDHDIIILSGGARGADLLGERYAGEKGFRIEKYPAEWDKYGRAAGMRRNREMAEEADAVIAFWDGKSHGTKNMIDIAENMGLMVRTIMV